GRSPSSLAADAPRGRAVPGRRLRSRPRRRQLRRDGRPRPNAADAGRRRGRRRADDGRDRAPVREGAPRVRRHRQLRPGRRRPGAGGAGGGAPRRRHGQDHLLPVEHRGAGQRGARPYLGGGLPRVGAAVDDRNDPGLLRGERGAHPGEDRPSGADRLRDRRRRRQDALHGEHRLVPPGLRRALRAGGRSGRRAGRERQGGAGGGPRRDRRRRLRRRDRAPHLDARPSGPDGGRDRRGGPWRGDGRASDARAAFRRL
ncbi:MAG: hypothetical protein AVDCRST_MAG19-3259, partial [uncultured Thermomicrobiales bacterium]